MKIGFIDYFLDEWHANNYPKFIADECGDDFTVAYAYAEIDKIVEAMDKANIIVY